VSGPKSAAVKDIDIDIAYVLGPEISANIDISKHDIDPALEATHLVKASQEEKQLYMRRGVQYYYSITNGCRH